MNEFASHCTLESKFSALGYGPKTCAHENTDAHLIGVKAIRSGMRANELEKSVCVRANALPLAVAAELSRCFTKALLHSESVLFDENYHKHNIREYYYYSMIVVVSIYQININV